MKAFIFQKWLIVAHLLALLLCLSLQYSVLLVIMILCQISVGIAVYVKKDQASELLTVAWDTTNNWQKVTLVQDPLQCCGLLIYNRVCSLEYIIYFSCLGIVISML